MSPQPETPHLALPTESIHIFLASLTQRLCHLERLPSTACALGEMGYSLLSAPRDDYLPTHGPPILSHSDPRVLLPWVTPKGMVSSLKTRELLFVMFFYFEMFSSTEKLNYYSMNTQNMPSLVHQLLTLWHVAFFVLLNHLKVSCKHHDTHP